MQFGKNSQKACSICVNGLVKKFGNFEAVKNVSLEVKEGEIFGLLGPNGAGKTTLISAICGLIELDKGTVLVFGTDVKKNRDKAVLLKKKNSADNASFVSAAEAVPNAVPSDKISSDEILSNEPPQEKQKKKLTDKSKPKFPFSFLFLVLNWLPLFGFCSYALIST